MKFFLYCALPSRFLCTIGAFEPAIQMHMLCNWDNAKLGPSPELWRVKTQESEQVLIWLYNLNSKFLTTLHKRSTYLQSSIRSNISFWVLSSVSSLWNVPVLFSSWIWRESLLPIPTHLKFWPKTWGWGSSYFFNLIVLPAQFWEGISLTLYFQCFKIIIPNPIWSENQVQLHLHYTQPNIGNVL